MTEKKESEPTPPKHVAAPEEEARSHIAELELALTKTSGEIKTLKGLIENNNPNDITEIKAKNNSIQGRIDRLEKALFILITEAFTIRTADDMKVKIEVLRLSAIDYFKTAKINKELWKNIES
jgi:hypothetical protein